MKTCVLSKNNMKEKCNDRYTFQTNRIPNCIADLIFKQHLTIPGC
jgi:hypothetical protein